jgi:hypothetical protein
VNYYSNGGGSVGRWTWSDIFSLKLFPIASKIHISKEKRSEGMRDETRPESNEFESRGQNIRIPDIISYSEDNEFLTEHHEDGIDRPSNDTRDPQRQHKSRQPSWGALRTVRVIMIEVFPRSAPNRAAAFSTVPWLLKAVEDWGYRTRLTQKSL